MPPKKVVNRKTTTKSVVNPKKIPVTSGKLPSKTPSTKSEPSPSSKTPAKPVWTERDDKAVIIQKYIRRHLAKKRLAKLRVEKVKYENELEELEKKAYLEIVKREQQEAERLRKLEEEERKRNVEFNRRRKEMLEAAFDGNLPVILSILKKVEESDDQMGASRDFVGQNLRKRHLLEIINCEDANNNTPISEAASGGYADVIQFLVDKGAHINCRGQFKRTPLYRASFAGNLDAVETLLRNGADPKMYADDAQTPFDVASVDAVKEFIGNWNYAETEKLLKKIEQVQAQLVTENKKRIETELDNLDTQISRAEKEFETSQKRLNKAYCELNKRIQEHDKAVAKGFEKIDITEKCIHDAEFEVESARMQFDKNRDALSHLRLRKREKQKEEGLASGEEYKRPGIECNIREFDDVLFKDVGDRISSSGKWPLVIDPSGQAATFLRYRDTNYVNALNPGDMDSSRLRLAILGSLMYGKQLVIDLMEVVESLRGVQNRLDELSPRLAELLMASRSEIIRPSTYLPLLRPEDAPEYEKNKFSETRTQNFKFILLTSNSLPPAEILDSFQPIWIHVG